MGTNHVIRGRLGAAALAASSLLILVGQLLHPDISGYRDLSLDPVGAARAYASTGFVVADILFIFAFTLFLFGILSLYTFLAASRAEGTAFAGLLLSIAGVGLFQTLNGLGAFALPAAALLALQGQMEALDVIAAILSGSAIVVAALGIVMLALGALLFGVAIWRSGTLPRWAGVLYAAAFLLLLAVPQPPKVVRLLEGVCITVAGVWLAAGIWRQTPASATEPSLEQSQVNTSAAKPIQSMERKQ